MFFIKKGSLKISKRLLGKTKFVLVFCLSSILITSCSNKTKMIEEIKIEDSYVDDVKETVEQNIDINIKPIRKVKPLIEEASMLVVGDNLISSTIIKAAYNGETYNFDSLFENIKEELDNADIKVINQETILVDDPNDYSGYPRFGSPLQVGEAIKEAGFNVVLHATNHAVDKGFSGIEQTLNFWDKYPEITVLGIHESEEDSNEINVIEVNGIKIGMLNYTFSLNGLTIPSDKEFAVDTLYDTEKIKSDIERSEYLSDLTIIFVHYGNEYVYNPSDYQIDISNIMAEAGADLIVGGHPHVVEPLDYITTSDNRTVPVYYSLGNFVSTQAEDPRMLGGMALIKITKKYDKISLDCNLLPIVTQYEATADQKYKPFTTYTLEDYNDSLGSKNANGLSLDYLYDLWNSIVKEPDKVYKKN